MSRSNQTNQIRSRLFRSIALLLHSGIPLSDALHLLAREESDALSTLLSQLGSRVDDGSPLWEAMEVSGEFPAHAVTMIRIAEYTGRAEQTLQLLADYYDSRHRNGRLLRNAVAYPAMILLLMLVVIGVLLIHVLPVFDQVYASLGSRLTGIAAGLLGLGAVLKRLLPVLWVILALLAAGALCFSLCKPFRSRITGCFSRVFADRGLLRQFQNVRFAQGLSMGLASGLPVEEAIDLAATLLSDTPGAHKRCLRCVQLLKEGASLSHALTQAALLSAADGRMLAAGIRGGNADMVMAAIAEHMQQDAQQRLEDAVARVEPAMVLVASALVGMILLCVMLPLTHILAAIG